MAAPIRLSIIVPVLNEAAVVVRALTRLRAIAPDAQVVVVDGGSSDGTAALAAPFAKVVTTPPGRAAQMNAGAAEAVGDWLLFLHVDTTLPDRFLDAIAAAEFAGREVGVFRLRIVGRHPLLLLLSLGANLRTRWRRIFLGDQAMFIRRALFQALGGFPPLPLLEDYAFALDVKARRVPVYLSPLKVETSGRRWERGGFFRTWWLFRRIFFRYHRGLRGGTAPAPPVGYDRVR